MSSAKNIILGLLLVIERNQKELIMLCYKTKTRDLSSLGFEKMMVPGVRALAKILQIMVFIRTGSRCSNTKLRSSGPRLPCIW